MLLCPIDQLGQFEKNLLFIDSNYVLWKNYCCPFLWFRLFLFLKLHVSFSPFLAEIDECIEENGNNNCQNGATCQDLVCIV